jgi:hypothetical protein
LISQRANALYYILPDGLGRLEDRGAKVVIESAGSGALLSACTKIDFPELIFDEMASDDVNTLVNDCFSVIV